MDGTRCLDVKVKSIQLSDDKRSVKVFVSYEGTAENVRMVVEQVD